MNRPRLVNLLDDFALGGVSRGLAIFASAPVRALTDAEVLPISPGAVIAPRTGAQIIVIHFPPNWRRLAFLASLRLRNPEATIIHVEHSYTRAWEAARVGHRARFRAMLGIALRLVDQVVCVSHAQARWLAEAAGLETGSIAVIYPHSENPGLGAVAMPDFARPGPLRIGAIGRFHEAKGFDRLIEAWKAGAMPGTELVIGGFGPEDARLRELAAGDPGIRFAGRVDDVAQFLAGCDVVAIPSRWEAFGQVATEARLAGRPILVAPVDGLPEQVGAAGQVVDFTDDAAIARAIAGLGRESLARMASAGRDATRAEGARRQSQWAGLLADAIVRYHRTPAGRYRLA